MIVNYNINSNLVINGLMDLNKLKVLEDNGLKVNKSRIARELDVDRRTVTKYINGYTKSSTRKRDSSIDEYYPVIKELLANKHKIFEYKKILYQYLKDNYGLACAESSFRRYIKGKEEFQSYFDSNKCVSTKAPTLMRFETSEGEQCQLDWKESLDILTNTGESICVNVLVLMMSYSRFRVYRLSLSKTQDVLFHLLNQSFETIGGIPKTMLTDNMKTVMDEPRTEYKQGKVNSRFQQFADDYGFEVWPCIAGRPNTKAKVESPMKILDELKAYSGDLSYEQLIRKLEQINDRENTRFHKEYNMVPVLGLEKEKDFLSPLPTESIRNHYKIKTVDVKVNASSMITFKGNQYSVPPKYRMKILKLQNYDNQIHLYSNTELIAVHDVSSKKINYLEDHYIEICKLTLTFSEEKITEIAKDNLRKIGERYTK